MRFRTDYIMGIYSPLFHNVAVQDSRNNMDHYSAHSRYLGKRTRFPIRPLETPDMLDRMFAKIRRAITRPSLR